MLSLIIITGSFRLGCHLGHSHAEAALLLLQKHESHKALRSAGVFRHEDQCTSSNKWFNLFRQIRVECCH